MKCYREISTTVGITIGYLTSLSRWVETLSTTVEITIGYLTLPDKYQYMENLQQ